MSRVYNTGESDEDLQRAYNSPSSPLRHGQNIMLSMLSYIDKICTENDIAYRIDSGNILGAIRHGGFIPWDDDMDIALLRADFLKLHKILKEAHHDRFTLQDSKTEQYYFGFWYKLRDRYSHHISEENKKSGLVLDGFQIDIFPIIVGPIPFLKKIDFKLLRLCYWRKGNPNYTLFRMLHIGLECIIHPLFRLASRLFGDKEIIGYDYGIPFWGTTKKEIQLPYKNIKFENLTVFGPANPHEWCRVIYGDTYMDLPPKEKRTGHSVTEYVFDEK